MNHFCKCCGRASALGIDLTAHERAILYWVVRGETCPQIAKRFGRAIGTVRSEVNRAHQKLGTNTRFNLIKIGTDYLDVRSELKRTESTQSANGVRGSDHRNLTAPLRNHGEKI